MIKQILVVGSLNMDLVVQADHLPHPGETIIEGVLQTFPGGKGANQAVAAARMGGRVKMLGQVGNDAYAVELTDNLSLAGVNTRHILRNKDLSTGVAVITVDKAGENTIVVASGANMALGKNILTSDPSLFDGVGVLISQLEIPLPVVFESMRIAKIMGITTILNPAPARVLPEELYKFVDFIIPNRIELDMLTGQRDLHTGIHSLLDRGVGTVVVTCGEDGAVLVDRYSEENIPVHRVKAVDTVAAGDAFCGAFAVGLAEGMSANQSARMANAAAAISVTRRGAQPSLPIRLEVDAFLLNNG